MVVGVDRFRDHFSSFNDAYVVIGGVACDVLLSSQGLTFRATKDVDIVLVVERMTTAFRSAIWNFIALGDYELCDKSPEGRVLYRFAKPRVEGFPVELEFFCRKPEGIDLTEDQRIVPIRETTEGSHLSAILMDDDYYEMILGLRKEFDGLPVIQIDGMIPLKACAWLDMSRRKAGGDRIDQKKVDKHRNDVFRLVATLPAERGTVLPAAIRRDLSDFVNSFPAESEQWSAIRASIKQSLGAAAPIPQDLLHTLSYRFHLDDSTQ